MREREKGGGESRPCIHTRTHICMQWRIESWWCQEPCPWFGCTPWVGSMPPKFVFNFNCHLTSRSWHIVIAGSIRGQARLKKKKQIVFTDLLQRVWQLYTHSVYNGNLLNVTRILRTANSQQRLELIATSLWGYTSSPAFAPCSCIKPALLVFPASHRTIIFLSLVFSSLSVYTNNNLSTHSMFYFQLHGLINMIIMYLRILIYSTSSSLVWYKVQR